MTMHKMFPSAEQEWNTEQGCLGLVRHWDASLAKAEAERIVAGLVDELPKKDRLIDLGCGSGRLIPHLGKFRKYTGYDTSPLLLAEARRVHGDNPAVMLVEYDIRQLAPYRKPVDLVLSIDTSLHYYEPLAFLDDLIVGWSAGSYLLNVLYGPARQEMLNVMVVSQAELETWQAKYEVVRFVDQPLPDFAPLTVRFLSLRTR